MNVGIFLGHPAHFHYFKNTARQLKANGHNVFFAVKEKDILEMLMRDAGFEYDKVRGKREKSDKLHLATSVLEIDWKLGRFVRKHKIDILIGAILPYASRISGARTIVIGEDDAAVVPLYSWLALPGANNVVSPVVCDNWHWEYKSIKYPANLELAYLHPNHFTPDPEVVRSYGIPVPSSPSQLSPFYSDSDSQLVPQVPNNSSINAQKEQVKPYFILRFASLNAHHDSGIKGINTEIAQRLVDILKPHGQIYITSERPLEPQFEQYRIRINPLDMHHVMAFASLYIGDSQTMAAEAGVLGTPFVRFNDFVGRIGYLRELEDTYHLGFGIKASSSGSVDQLCARVQELVSLPAPERQTTFQSRRTTMLSDKIDCAKFLTWFIENYPWSVEDTRKADQSFWGRFK